MVQITNSSMNLTGMNPNTLKKRIGHYLHLHFLSILHMKIFQKARRGANSSNPTPEFAMDVRPKSSFVDWLKFLSFKNGKSTT